MTKIERIELEILRYYHECASKETVLRLIARGMSLDIEPDDTSPDAVWLGWNIKKIVEEKDEDE